MANADIALPSVLIVEPDPAFRSVLVAAAGGARVEEHGRFDGARPRLLESSFDLLVSSIRLGAYNGLHLVYAARLSGVPTRAIVYDDVHNLGLAREALVACAFYELRERLPVVLASYLHARLPVADRRDPRWNDRRTLARGGRRRWDQYVAGSFAGPAY